MNIRHYGLSIGDEVINHFDKSQRGVVKAMTPFDNNWMLVKLPDGKIIDAVCEHWKKVDRKLVDLAFEAPISPL